MPIDEGLLKELVDALVGPARYREDDLACGLRHEHHRLGTRPYLVALWRSEFDQDGLTDWLTLIESYETLDDARHAAEAESQKLLTCYTDASDPLNAPWGRPWLYIPSRDSRPEYLPKPLKSSGASERHRQTFALRREELESMYCSFYVLGPFNGGAIGRELAQLFSESRMELWSYLADIGGGTRKGTISPVPAK